MLLRIVSLLLLVQALGTAPAHAQGFQLIVNDSNDVRAVTPELAADLFLKKAIFWPSGEAVRPVDLAAGEEARKRFSRTVLDKPVALVKTYWQQQVFRGRDVPPPELATVEEVLEFVRRHRGAVGYVPDTVRLDRGVRRLEVRPRVEDGTRPRSASRRLAPPGPVDARVEAAAGGFHPGRKL